MPRISMMERALVWYARRFPVSRGKLRIVNAAWHLAAHGSYFREASLIYGRFRAPCDIREMLQRQLYFFGTYYVERHLLELWADFARNAHVVCDIGANAGIYSLAALSVNQNNRVHAFEPTPEIADRLRQTAEMNGLDNLFVAKMALSDHQGKARLIRSDGGRDNGGMNFIISADAGDAGEIVDLMTLDTYCDQADIDQIDLLKIDVQGVEPAVLRGAESLLRDGRIRIIFVELNWSEGDEYCAADEVIALLDAHRFQFSAAGSHLDWKPAGAWIRGHSDVLARRFPNAAGTND